MNTLTAIALSGVLQGAAASDDAGVKSGSPAPIARVSVRSRVEQRFIAAEQRRVVREQQNSQTQEIRTAVKSETVSSTRQEVYQSIQDAKVVAREQARKLVEEEKALLRSGG